MEGSFKTMEGHKIKMSKSEQMCHEKNGAIEICWSLHNIEPTSPSGQAPIEKLWTGALQYNEDLGIGAGPLEAWK